MRFYTAAREWRYATCKKERVEKRSKYITFLYFIYLFIHNYQYYYCHEIHSELSHRHKNKMTLGAQRKLLGNHSLMRAKNFS